MITINRYIIEIEKRNVKISLGLPFDNIDSAQIVSERNEEGKTVQSVVIKCLSGDEERRVQVKVKLIPMKFPLILDTTEKIQFIESVEEDE